MRKVFKLFLIVLFLIPLNCFALTQYEDHDADFIYQIDADTWEELDETSQGIFSVKRWKGNCGLLGIMKTDMYAELLKKDSTSEISRDSLNYKNNFKYMADSFISGLNQNEVYDLNNWEYYDSNKVKFAKFSGIYKESDLRYDMGGYFTFNNGYAFVIIYIKDASANQIICDNSFIGVANSVSPKTEPKVLDESSNSGYLDDLSLTGILIGLLITVVSYMIIPFILVVLLKKQYDKQSVKKMAFWNSFGVGLVYLILTVSMYEGKGAWSAAPAFLYYCINCVVWVHRDKEEKIKNNSIVKVKEESKIINDTKENTHEEILEVDYEIVDNSIYNEAVSLYQLSKYDEAVPLFKKYIEQVLKKNKNEKKWTTCNNMLEFYIYCYTNNSKEEIQDLNYRVNTSFLYLAMIDYEKGENEQAIANINKGLKYDPADTKLMFEKAENYKVLHDMKKFYDNTIDIYKYIYTKSDLAKYYRNLGYYFVEKKDYELAKTLYLYSLRFENNKIVNKELEYIISKSDDSLPAKNRLENILSKNNIPLFIDENVIDIIIKLDQELKANNNGNTSFGKFIKHVREDLQI